MACADPTDGPTLVPPVELDARYSTFRYVVASFYYVLWVYVLYLLWRLWNTPGRRWQQSFYAFVALASAGRAVYFTLQPFIYEGELDVRNCVNSLLSVIPSLFFFSAYLVLIFFWAEIYHNSAPTKSETTISRLRPTYFGISATMYVVFAVLYSIDLGFCYTVDLECDPAYPTFNTTFQLVASGLLASIYLMLGTSFALYGFRFYGVLARISQSSVFTRIARFDVVSKVQLILVASLLTAIFLTRCALIIKNMVNDTTSALWWFDPTYYILLELFPVTVMLYVFRSPSSHPHGPVSVAVNDATEHGSERTGLLASNSQPLFSPVSVSRWKLFSGSTGTGGSSTTEGANAHSHNSQYLATA